MTKKLQKVIVYSRKGLTMKNVLMRLQEYVKQASATEKSVIIYLLEKTEEAGELNIHELAEKTYSSPSTVIRLCKKVGFDGYKDFRKSLLYELGIRKETGMKRMEEIRQEDSLEEIVNKVTIKNIVSLENTMKLVDLTVLKRSVDLLVKADAIHLFGLGASLVAAQDAYLKFLRVRKSCFISSDVHAQYLQAMNAKKDSVAIILSYSGRTQEMINCAEELNRNQVPIILISKFGDSPLAKMADCNLCVAATEYIVRSGAMSSRISQLNIIDILYTAYINQDFENNMRRLQRTHIKKQEE